MTDVQNEMDVDDNSALLPKNSPGSLLCCSKSFLVVLVAILLVVTIGLVIAVAIIASPDRNSNPKLEGECDFTPRREEVTYNEHVTVLIKNATIWTGYHNETLDGYDILLKDGKIGMIEVDIVAEPEWDVYDVQGTWVTPGLVDQHSHAGIIAWPEGFGTSDGNEATDPTLPQVRAIDAIDADGLAIPLIREGGVTSSLVLPGSANVMGGQAISLKMRGFSVEEMRIKNAPIALKMACGENPKRSYGSKPGGPSTRMGVGWQFRKKFDEARRLKKLQDNYCSDESAGGGIPYDMSLSNLVDVLRGNALVNIHSYTVRDMQMAIRVSKEFGFQIRAFHHAVEAWRIPKELKENGISVAIFADNWGFKMEAYNASVLAGKILNEAGVDLVYKTDHPVLYGRELIYEAQKAYHYGTPANTALRAVTSVPAYRMGLSDRIGTLELGKDADVVVWDRHPLSLGAIPTKVFIEGEMLVHYDYPYSPEHFSVSQPTPVMVPINIECNSTRFDEPLAEYGIINAFEIWDNIGPVTSGAIHVFNGTIVCAGPTCDPPPGIPTFDLQNQGVVMPGVVSAGNNLGLVELSSETSFQDGTASGDVTSVHPEDGIKLEGKKIPFAWGGGVLSSVTFLTGGGEVQGASVAWYLYGTTPVLDDSMIIKTEASLQIGVGSSYRGSGLRSSVSGQFASLRSLFSQHFNDTDGIYSEVFSGEIPLVVRVNNADDISRFLRFKTDYPNLNIVIFGGSEAYLVASQLAATNTIVILTGGGSTRCVPSTFHTSRCDITRTAELVAAGVQVGYAITGTSTVRNLRFGAGWAHVRSGLSREDAIASITSTIADAFGLPFGVGRIASNTLANLVVYNGDPLSLSSSVDLTAIGGSIACYPPPGP